MYNYEFVLSIKTSCLTAIKNHWIKYCEKNNYFYIRFFYALYTTLPHNLIRNQLVDLIENRFRREEALYLACNEERAFFASEEHKKYDLWSCQKVTDALIYLLDNIYI